MMRTDSTLQNGFRVMFLLLFPGLLLAGCEEKLKPPQDWNSLTIAYKTPVSETGFAGYYTSFQDKKFLTFAEFMSEVPGRSQWTKAENGIWILNVGNFPSILNDEGPVTLYFAKQESPSGNTNVVLTKGVTEKYEIPLFLLDQIVIQMGESFSG